MGKFPATKVGKIEDVLIKYELSYPCSFYAFSDVIAQKHNGKSTIYCPLDLMYDSDVNEHLIPKWFKIDLGLGQTKFLKSMEEGPNDKSYFWQACTIASIEFAIGYHSLKEQLMSKDKEEQNKGIQILNQMKNRFEKFMATLHDLIKTYVSEC